MFGDICERLPQELVKRLDEIEAIVVERYEEALNVAATAVAKKEVLEQHAAMMKQGMDEVLDGREFNGSTSWCHVHHKECPISDTTVAKLQGLVHVVFAGTSCVDNCPPGLRRVGVGRTTKPFTVFMHKMNQTRPAMLFHECSHLFQPKHLKSHLGSEYVVFPVKMNPQMFGWLLHCGRLFTLCILKEKFAMHYEATADQYELFRQEVLLTGDVFFAAPCGRSLIGVVAQVPGHSLNGRRGDGGVAHARTANERNGKVAIGNMSAWYVTKEGSRD